MNSKTRYSLMIVLLATFTLSVGSCIPHIRGNGKVVKEERSGANLKVNVTKAIKAHCSSGAQISVTGNPTTRDTNSSSGGSVHFK